MSKLHERVNDLASFMGIGFDDIVEAALTKFVEAQELNVRDYLGISLPSKISIFYTNRGVIQKIQAIKALRTLTQLGLKESKDVIDAADHAGGATFDLSPLGAAITHDAYKLFIDNMTKSGYTVERA